MQKFIEGMKHLSLFFIFEVKVKKMPQITVKFDNEEDEEKFLIVVQQMFLSQGLCRSMAAGLDLTETHGIPIKITSKNKD